MPTSLVPNARAHRCRRSGRLLAKSSSLRHRHIEGSFRVEAVSRGAMLGRSSFSRGRAGEWCEPLFQSSRGSLQSRPRRISLDDDPIFGAGLHAANPVTVSASQNSKCQESLHNRDSSVDSIEASAAGVRARRAATSSAESYAATAAQEVSGGAPQNGRGPLALRVPGRPVGDQRLGSEGVNEYITAGKESHQRELRSSFPDPPPAKWWAMFPTTATTKVSQRWLVGHLFLLASAGWGPLVLAGRAFQ